MVRGTDAAAMENMVDGVGMEYDGVGIGVGMGVGWSRKISWME